mgnify:CR=1 FL=1
MKMINKIKKNVTAVIVALVLTASLAACGKADNTGKRNDSGTGVSDVLDEGVSKEEAKSETTTKATTEEITTQEITTEEVKEDETTTEENEASDVTSDENTPKEATVVPPEVDVDLTTLSSTMVYSEVYNMMTTPDDYLGKNVKMAGNFAVYTDEATGKVYFACIIQDATACCAQGIEFVLAGDYRYPEDYPNVNDIITVTGTFNTYEEDGWVYCTLLDATME